MRTLIEPGEVYWTTGAYYPKHRVIIISRELLNRGDYVVGVPITSARVHERMNLPNCVFFERGQFGFTRDCVAQADAIQAFDVSEFDLVNGPVCTLPPDYLDEVRKAVAYVIELSDL